MTDQTPARETFRSLADFGRAKLPAISFERAPENGRPMAVARCPECDHTTRFPCEIGQEGNARRRLHQKGWSIKGTGIKCPTCTKKDRAMNETTKTQPKPETVEAPPQPTRQQRREIMEILSHVYDMDNERYMGGETDETVATVLKVRIGWVQEIREEFFGPEGKNEDMADLAGRIEAAILAAETDQRKATAYANDLTAVIAQLRTMQDDLKRITAAVGERARKKAGLAA